MEVDRYALYCKIVLRVLNGIVDSGIVERIDHHVDTQMPVSAFSDVLFQLRKRTLSADFHNVTSPPSKSTNLEPASYDF